MKSIHLFLCALVLSASGCKLEPSSVTANNNANANTSQPANVNSGGEQEPKTNCSLSLAAAPSVNGVKLGMTTEEVLALFPGSKTDPDIQTYVSRPASPLGVSELAINPSKFQPPEKFPAIKQFTLQLLDGRISTLTAHYEGPQYSDVDQFVAKFLEGKNVPPIEQWQAHEGMESQLKILRCSEVEIRVFAGGEGGNLNYVLMTDLEAQKRLRERREKARAKGTPSP
jgi:hypothetical protein